MVDFHELDIMSRILMWLILDPAFSVNDRLEVRMSIKPRSPNGTIFSVTDTPKGDFLSMEMINGVVSIDLEKKTSAGFINLLFS